MAKILYGVAGEGFGHSSRSHLIGQELLDQGHDVQFVGFEKSYRYLNQHFPGRVNEIKGFEFVYRDTGVSMPRTVLYNIGRFPSMWRRSRRCLRRDLKDFEPDLVISDFEPFTARWAVNRGIPCISIDHEHLLCKCDYRRPDNRRINGYLSTFFTNRFLKSASAYLVLNFFQAPSRDARVKVVNPVVRRDVLGQEPHLGDAIICYATSKSWKKRYLQIFSVFPEQRFILYGFDEEVVIDNCEFRPHSTQGFLRDLAGCRGVIATGGFSLISECFYLRKKMLVNPIHKQYEQEINATNLARMNMAQVTTDINIEAVADFLDFTKTPLSSHPDVLWPDNNAFFTTLDQTMRQVTAGRVMLWDQGNPPSESNNVA